MKTAVIFLISASVLAQTTDSKAPTYTTETVTRQVAHCEAGWHLERWHYGTDSLPTWVDAVYRSDPSGYRPVEQDKPDPHPEMCVKDTPKK